MNPLDKDLTTLADALGALASEIIGYAAEDNFGGFHSDPEQSKFPVGSLWGVEGQVLYALCRLLRPDHVVEIGTWRGASAVHILSALEKNDHGRLTSIDLTEGVGDLIPQELRHRWTKVTGSGQVEIPRLDTAQIVFEDGPHDADGTAELVRVAAEHLHPKILISHDAEHFLVGKDVSEGWRRVFGDGFSTFLTPPSDCGLAFKVF